jgi:photosystem II stability/assembly factor-like uncharacterized protein
MLKLIITIFLLSNLLHPQSDSLSISNIDYRNRINVPEYDPSLMPLNYNRSTGIWTELNPQVPRVDYLGVDFIDSLTGWAVGANGSIIKTTDGGNKWKHIPSGVTNTLTHVNTFDGNVIIAVGYQGKILRSSDGGGTWTSISGSAIQDLWRVQMINDSLGWISGRFSTLLKTTDGGLTWQSVSTGFPQDYWSLDFLNENLGYISCGFGTLLKTTNGGTSWQQLYIGENVALYCVTILDEQTVVTGGFTRIAVSTNGGSNWNIVSLGGIFYSIDFTDMLNGIALSDASVYKTTDGGITWEYMFGSPSPHYWVTFVNPSLGFYVGGGLKVQRTTDSGATWQQLILNDNFYDLHFINESTGFIVSGSQYKTTDGGESFIKQSGKPGGYSIKFLDSLTGFIGNNNGSIIKTTDGGETWQSKHSNQSAGQIHKFLFLNDSVGWALGGWALKTTDKGETWISKSGGGTSIYFIDSLVGWITRNNARPLKTIDEGETWEVQNSFPYNQSDDVYFKNLDTGWIGRYSSINNSLFKTTDGGLSWDPISAVIGARKFYFFPDPIHWLIIGFSRYYITNDFGNTWLEFTTDVPSGLVRFAAPTNNLGYFIGNLGLILKYDDTTYVPVELIVFTATVYKNNIILNWSTSSELNNSGFEIEKSYDRESWSYIDFVEGNGTTTNTNHYSFIDNKISSRIQFYRLKQIDYNGSYEYSNIIEIKVDSPSEFFLEQNYPNPFNPSTKISFSLKIDSKVTLKIFNMLGKEITTLINEDKAAGYYNIEFNAYGFPSGVYFFSLITEGANGEIFSSVKKMMIIK